MFQSTPPREGRPSDGGYFVGEHVSIHAPTRGATERFLLVIILIMFQSTPPREGRPYVLSNKLRDLLFQSTPPREGRRNNKVIIIVSNGFNPRPHARGDVGVKWFRTESISFNPRPHARGDVPPVEVPRDSKVSIHAPTRGATYNCCESC